MDAMPNSRHSGSPFGNDQRTPLVAPVASAVLPVTASPLAKLLCALLTLLLLSASFIAALNVSQEELGRHGGGSEHHSDTGSEHHEEESSRTEVAGMLVKCVLPLLGFIAFLYLLCRVVVAETVRGAVLTDPNQPEGVAEIGAVLTDPNQPEGVAEIGAVARCLKMPHSLINSPTTFFNLIFALFSILGTHSAVLDYVTGLIKCNLTGFEIFVETIEFIAMVAFALIQLYFFWMHSRVCLQWKLDGAWLAFSAIISVNLSCWFFHTGFEIAETLGQNPSSECGTSNKTNPSWSDYLQTLAESFSPFLSECFLMGAILSGTVLSNAGRWARALGRKVQSGASVEEAKSCINAVDYHVTGKFGKKFRRHWLKAVLLYAFSLGVVIGTLLAKSSLACTKSIEDWNASLNRICVTCYIAGILGCAVPPMASLACRFCSAPDRHRHRSAAHVRHTADRLMLWCALAGIVVYRLQRLWKTLISAQSLPLLEGGTSLLNIVQSVLQVIVIECILAGRIRNLHPWLAEAAAWFLMFLNAAEWFIYASAFSLILTYRNEDSVNQALAIVAMPLHVFFYFHSIGCFYDFKEYMHRPRRPAASDGLVNAGYQPIEDLH